MFPSPPPNSGRGAIAEYSLHSLVSQKTGLTQTKTLNPNVRKQELNSSLAAVC